MTTEAALPGRTGRAAFCVKMIIPFVCIRGKKLENLIVLET